MNIVEQKAHAKIIIPQEEVVASEVHAPIYEEVSRSLESENDVLHQFRANLQQLEDLTGRLRFVLTEVKQSYR